MALATRCDWAARFVRNLGFSLGHLPQMNDSLILEHSSKPYYMSPGTSITTAEDRFSKESKSVHEFASSESSGNEIYMNQITTTIKGQYFLAELLTSHSIRQTNDLSSPLISLAYHTNPDTDATRLAQKHGVSRTSKELIAY